jgi:hypothetical protein
MKAVLIASVALVGLISCSDQKAKETTVSSDSVSAIMAPETTGNMMNTDTGSMNNGSNTMNNGSTTMSSAYAPGEGDVTYRNGKVMVWRNGNYVVADRDVQLNNGITVSRSGEVSNKDKKVKLEEGESIDRSGNFFNKAGEALEDGWDATKKGVKKAGQAIKKAGQKVGEEAKDLVQ